MIVIIGRRSFIFLETGIFLMGFWANTPKIIWLWGWSLKADAYNGAFLGYAIISGSQH